MEHKDPAHLYRAGFCFPERRDDTDQTDARASHLLRAGDAVQPASCLYLQRDFSRCRSSRFDDSPAEARIHGGMTVVLVKVMPRRRSIVRGRRLPCRPDAPTKAPTTRETP